ncbi:hypothetical protein O181_080416 [Austropuccinia psidii MF-1]|uniref:Uncharacterized protein n=1 Tax=Austropuccinia psidii MF-1 TaxID=1389203 RepID=A0A9Q3IEX7_9BASI|nr:hypothetical protein [Austropuccinia psidii MF-1]
MLDKARRLSPRDSSLAPFATVGMSNLKAPASHFSKLLRESKVVGSVDPKLEQVYTSYNGYLNHHREFGLKRSLPTKLSARSPWIRLKSLDTAYRQIDYRSASPQTSLVKMWNQIQVGVVTARKNHAPSSNLSSEPGPIRIEFSWFDQGSRESAHLDTIAPKPSQVQSSSNRQYEKRPPKHIWSMYQGEFEKFLDVMRTRRDQFKAFLEAKERRRADSTSLSPNSSDQKPPVTIDLYQYAQGNPDRIIKDLEDFLAYVANAEPVDESNLSILPLTHPNLGLNYAHFDKLHNERLTPSIPGRVLDQADLKFNRQTASFAGIVSSIQRSSHIDLPCTSFEPDVNGYHNIDQGKAKFRVESAAIDPYDLPLDHDFQGFNSQADQPVQYTDPRNRPRALRPNRLKVILRESGQSDATRVNATAKIGSRQWVGSDPPKRQGTIVLDFLSSVSRTLQSSSSPFSLSSPDSSHDSNDSKASSVSKNEKGRMSQIENDQLMKVLKDLVERPS